MRPKAASAITAAAFVALTLISGAAIAVDAQTVVPVHEEPRHRLVLDREPIRILDVQIQPGDTSLFHTHTSAILYVTIGVTTTNQQTLGAEWGNVNPANPPRGRPGNIQYVTSYAEQPLTHRVTNVGESLFRLIAIANYGAGVHGDDQASGEEVGGPVEVETPWHRAWRIVLEPGQSSVPHRTSMPLVGVQIANGQLEVSTAGSRPQRLSSSGEWFFTEPGTEYAVKNTGTEQMEVVLVQLR